MKIIFLALPFIIFLNKDVYANKLHIDIKSLPMNLSFERIKGKGSRKIYIFCDVDCPHCMRAERLFSEIGDIKINTFVFPVVSYHPDAPRKTNAIWCSKDRAKAWQEWFDSKQLPPNPKYCKAPLGKIQKYADKNGIRLPVIIFEDGTGYHADDFIYATLDLETLQNLIDNHSKN